MPTTETRPAIALGASDRVAVIAGSGRLPVDVARRPEGRAGIRLSSSSSTARPASAASSTAYDHATLELEEHRRRLVALLKRERHHPCRAGRRHRPPAAIWPKLRPSLDCWRMLPRVAAGAGARRRRAARRPSSSSSRSAASRSSARMRSCPTCWPAKASLTEGQADAPPTGATSTPRSPPPGDRRARHRPGGGRDRRPRRRARGHRGHRRPAGARDGAARARPARRQDSAACWSNAPSPARNCAPTCRRSDRRRSRPRMRPGLPASASRPAAR